MVSKSADISKYVDVPATASACRSLDELQRWRVAEYDSVPELFRPFAADAIEQEIADAKATLEQEKAEAKAQKAVKVNQEASNGADQVAGSPADNLQQASPVRRCWP